MDVITAISQLWPILLIMLGFVCVFKFGNDIKLAFRNRNLKFKTGNTEVETTLASIQDDTIQLQQKAFLESTILEKKDKDNISLTRVQIEETISDKKDLRMQLFQAYENHDIPAMTEIYNKMEAEERDSINKVKNKSLFLTLMHKRGDISALSKLLELSNERLDTHAKIQVLKSIASCYQFSGNINFAIDYYDQILKICSTLRDYELETSDIIIQRCRYLNETNSTDFIIEQVNEYIRKTTDNVILAKYYEYLSELYKKDSKIHLACIAINRAVEYVPNDTNLLFKAGYLINEYDLFAEVSVLHYQAYLKYNDNKGVMNNLGVIYDKLHLRGVSVEMYKTAAKERNPLYVANLARVYSHYGFYEEAEELIHTELSAGKIDQNLTSAFNAIEKDKENGKEKLEKVILEAQKKHQFLKEFSKGFFDNIEIEETDIYGVWSEKNIDYTIEKSDDNIIVSWEHFYKYFIAFTLDHRSSYICNVIKKEYDFKKSAYTDIQNGICFLHLGSEIKMLIHLKSFTEFELFPKGELLVLKRANTQTR